MEKRCYKKTEYKTLETYYVFVEKVLVEGEFVQHTHDFDEIVIVLSGTAEHLVGEECYSVKCGDVFVIKGDMKHGFRKAEKLQIINIMYDSRILFAQNNNLQELEGFAYLFIARPQMVGQCEHICSVSLDQEAIPEIEFLYEFLKSQLQKRTGQYQVAIQYGFMTLVAYLANQCRTKIHISEKVQIFSRALQYMQFHKSEEIKVESIAKFAMVSVRQLERIFMDISGISPMVYLVELRLQSANELLRGTCRTITDIAEESGFSDPGYFTRIYKKKYGISPSQRRKMGLNMS